jgi:hypothetical protein
MLNQQDSSTNRNIARHKKQTSAFQFSVLTCAGRNQLATKIIHADGKETGYSLVKYFHFHYSEIDCLEDFAKVALTYLADQSNKFIIRGQLKPGVSGPQRRLIYPGQRACDY